MPAACSSIIQPLTPMLSSKLVHCSTSSPVSWYSPTTRRVSRTPT
jgi:hypothetical protein